MKWVKFMILKLIRAQSNRAIGFNKRSEPLNYGDGGRSKSFKNVVNRLPGKISVDKILNIMIIHNDKIQKIQLLIYHNKRALWLLLILKINRLTTDNCNKTSLRIAAGKSTP